MYSSAVDTGTVSLCANALQIFRHVRKTNTLYIYKIFGMNCRCDCLLDFCMDIHDTDTVYT